MTDGPHRAAGMRIEKETPAWGAGADGKRFARRMDPAEAPWGGGGQDISVHTPPVFSNVPPCTQPPSGEPQSLPRNALEWMDVTLGMEM